MKNTLSVVLLIVALFAFSACENKTIESDFQSEFPIDLSDLKLDFSGLDIDFELLFEYEDKKALLTEAENMFPELLKDSRDLISEEQEASHVLLSFKIADGKVKLKELLMYDSLHQNVKDYHNYTKKLGALDGLSADQELLNTAYNAIVPESYRKIEQFDHATNNEEQTQVFVNFLESNYQSAQDEIDFIVVVGTNKVRAYAN